MRKTALALALLLFVAMASAQKIVDVPKVQEAADNSLRDAATVLKLLQIVIIAVSIIAAVYVVSTGQSVSMLFTNRWFLAAFAVIFVIFIIHVVAHASAPFKEAMDYWKQKAGDCPLLLCP